MAKPKKTEPPPRMPTLTDQAERDRREHMAKNRARAAHQHLQAAREQLDAACRGLCSVIGANDLYRRIAKLSDGCKELRIDLNEREHTGEPMLFDRDVEHAECTRVHGCGQEPKARG